MITSVLVLVAALFALAQLLKPKKAAGAPGPYQWPIIGNLAFIGKFRDISEAFSHLREEYGNIVSFKLGVHKAVVISGLKNFREVLVENALHFDARPNFKRYYMLFSGNKDNSLAFADGSEEHHKQRAAIAIHTFARNGTNNFENLDNVTTENIYRFIEDLKCQAESDPKMDIKPQLGEALAATFVKYFTSMDVDTSDSLFKSMVSAFDVVFQEINAGCVGDVLPWLMPFINKKGEYAELNRKIKEYMDKCCIDPALKQRDGKIMTDSNNNECQAEGKANNVIHALLDLVETDKEITLEHATFAFADIVGGHSALSNAVIRILVQIAANPQVQENIRQELRDQGVSFPSISDKLSYTEATVWEAFRFISSPIVPHVSTQNTSINGIPIEKDTLVFFNNMDMNFSPDLWESPKEFMPERFISPEGRVLKPDFFLPFSTGKRGCLGYKLVINLGTVIVASLCQSFNIELDPSTNYDMERGIIAVGKDKAFPFVFKPLQDC